MARQAVDFRPAWRCSMAWLVLVVANTLVHGVGCASLLPNPGAAAQIRDDDNVLAVGDPTVTVIEYSDFQCPYCGRFARETFPVIKQQYIDTGKVRWVFRHLPLTFLHRYAEGAAEASECAADQGKFWEYHDILFDNASALTSDDLKTYAADLGLDTTAFGACVDGGGKAARVQEDVDSATAAGVPATPTFFINGDVHEGFQTAADFSALLDTAIAAAAQ